MCLFENLLCFKNKALKKILKIMNITCKCGVKLLKGVLLCFFSFFKFESVCHVYDKVTNQSYKSLSPLQKEIIRLKKIWAVTVADFYHRGGNGPTTAGGTVL